MEKVNDPRLACAATPPIRSLCVAVAVAMLMLGGCVRDHSRLATAEGDYGGTLVVSTGADADLLLPALTQTIMGAQISHLIFDLLALPAANLSTFGDDGFTPALAERWTWSDDSLSIAFHLHPDASWHDGVPVRAHDVAFTFALYTDPATGSHTAPLLRGIDSVTVADSLTAVFWYSHRHLEQFYQASYQMRVHPQHLLDTIPRAQLRSAEIARRPIGSGPFRFSSWVPGATLEVVADIAHYRGRPYLDRVVWTIAPDPSTLTTRLFSGEADFLETLRAESMTEFARNDNVRALPFPSLFQAFLLFNTRDPRDRSRPHALFGERELRRALSLAIDREAIVRNVYDSLALVAIGPVTRVLAGADTALGHLQFDPDRARHLLDSLGWRPRPDGVRQKAGRQLRFSMIVPTSSMPRMRMAVLLQEMLRQVGARADIEQMEFNTFASRQISRRFDAVIGFWALDPSPMSIRQVWSSEAADAEGGSNYGGYRNPRVDALLDSAGAELSPSRARVYLRRAYEELLQDAPAVFLAETVNFAGARRRIVPGALRPDGWWLTLHEWSIPADQRIGRDVLAAAPAP